MEADQGEEINTPLNERHDEALSVGPGLDFCRRAFSPSISDLRSSSCIHEQANAVLHSAHALGRRSFQDARRLPGDGLAKYFEGNADAENLSKLQIHSGSGRLLQTVS